MQVEQKIYTPSEGWQDLTPLCSQAPQLVLVFGSVALLERTDLIQQLAEWYPGSQRVFCSSSGNIIGDQVSDESLVVSGLTFEKSTIMAVAGSIANISDSFRAGLTLSKQLPKEGLRHILVFSEGVQVNGSELVKGINSELPGGVVATGGLGGDQGKFQKSLTGLNIQPESNRVVLVGLYGNELRVGYGSMGGWDSFGPDRLITKSEGNVLYELDGTPALELYKKYLGPQAEGLPSTGLLFPLSIHDPEHNNQLVRTILGVNETDQSLTFAGDIPQGYYARLMKANFDRLIEGAATAASITKKSQTATQFGLLISCIGRKLVLKQRTEEEVEAVHKVLGESSKITGFYSNGELSPVVSPTQQCELHNQTMTITTLAEE